MVNLGLFFHSSGNVKQEIIIRNWTYKLPHKLPNNLGLMVLENEELLELVFITSSLFELVMILGFVIRTRTSWILTRNSWIRFLISSRTFEFHFVLLSFQLVTRNSQLVTHNTCFTIKEIFDIKSIERQFDNYFINIGHNLVSKIQKHKGISNENSIKYDGPI